VVDDKRKWLFDQSRETPYNDDGRAYSQSTGVTFVEVMSETDAHGDLTDGH